MRGAGGPYQAACGDRRAAFSPTQAFSCFFPPVSVQQCPTTRGRDSARPWGLPRLQGGAIRGLGAAAAASPVPATSSPSQG